MLNMNVDALLHCVNGQLFGDVDTSISLTSAVIDSRSVIENSLFIAFNGEQVDGHDYINAAAEKGALVALVEEIQNDVSIAQIKVESCQNAMAAIAKKCRYEFQGVVIAITGSCGKTSCKEMLASILSISNSVSVTAGNQNNELGVPLTLFSLKADADYAVIEMGAAEQGDISYLMAMVEPHVSVISNIRPAHIGRFGSEEVIALTKSEIYRDLKPNAIAVVNVDEKYSAEWLKALEQRNTQSILTFSTDIQNTDVFISDLEIELAQSSFTLHYQKKQQAVTILVAGEHNVANALLAASCALAVGCSLADVAKGLSHYRGVESRMQVLQGSWGGVMIDDGYNANPGSVTAAINVLKLYPQKKIFVLGDMAELGADAQASHEYVGAFARNSGIDELLTFGVDSECASDSFGDNAKHFIDKDALTDYLLGHLVADDVVLIKGSRSAAMEDIIKPLRKEVGK